MSEFSTEGTFFNGVIADIAEINPRTDIALAEEERVSFLPMQNTSERGDIIALQERVFAQVSKGYTRFAENDVLVAKITPCFENGKGGYAKGLLKGIGFGSTEFHIVRAILGKADSRFLHHLTRSERFRKAGEGSMTGSAGQKRIPSNFIKDFPIFIPPLPEQKKIAEILSGIEITISQTSQRIEKHKTLLLATLEQIFGDLSEKADLKPLGDCCRHILDFRGRTPAKLGMEWGGGTIRALSANNVRDGFIDFNRECYLGSESLYKNWMTRGDCERGDIVFTMEAPMGNVAIIPDDERYILSQRVVLLSPDRQQILPEFLYWFMRSSRFRSDCENLATGTTAKGIKQANLITISVPIATIEEQEKAVQAPTSIERLISSEEQRLLQLNLIKQSLSADLLSGRKRVSI